MASASEPALLKEAAFKDAANRAAMKLGYAMGMKKEQLESCRLSLLTSKSVTKCHLTIFMHLPNFLVLHKSKYYVIPYPFPT